MYGSFRGHTGQGTHSHVASTGEGLIIVGEDGRIVAVNPAAEKLLGVDAGELLGRSYSDPLLGLATPQGKPLAQKEDPATRVLRTGGTVRDLRYYSRPLDGVRTLLSVAAGPLIGTSGTITGAALSLTERVEPERELSLKDPGWRGDPHLRLAGRLEAIGQMGSLLHAARSKQQVLEQIAEYASLLMDAPAALVLTSEGETEFRVGALTGAPESVRRLHLSRRAAEELGFDRPVPFFVPDIGYLREQPFFVGLASAGFGHCLALALFTETDLQGLLLLLGPAGVNYDQEDLATFRLFGVQAAAALETVALHELQQDILDTLQEAMLVMPESLPDLRFAHAYRSATEAAKVGGDFYDLFEVSENRVGILIGDVTGNGVPASIAAGLIRHAVRAYAFEGHPAARVLSLCNDLLIGSSSPPVFATAFFALLDTVSGEVLFSSAGHPPSFVRRADGHVEELWGPSLVLGAFSDTKFREESALLHPDDLLVLYTDGITEARRGRRLFGEDRFTRVLSQATNDPAESVDAILLALEDFSKGSRRDDLALLAVRLTPSEDSCR